MTTWPVYYGSEIAQGNSSDLWNLGEYYVEIIAVGPRDLLDFFISGGQPEYNGHFENSL